MTTKLALHLAQPENHIHYAEQNCKTYWDDTAFIERCKAKAYQYTAEANDHWDGEGHY